jgi:type VI secretion system secreted protein VgrG
MSAPEPFEFSAGSLHGATVLRFSGVERVSAPFRFDVELEIGAASGEDLRRLVGSRAALMFAGADGAARAVRGHVSRLARGRGGEAAQARLRVRIEPRLSLLRHTKRSRVFQDMTVKQIVDAVLDDARVPHTWRTAPAGAPREHCVQFQETDLEFFHRLLAEEGWFYFFDHPTSDGEERVVLAGRAEDYEPITGATSLRVSAVRGVVGQEDIERLELVRSIRSGGALLRAYDYTRPSYDMRGEAKRAREADLDEKDFVVYEHDHDPADGDLDGERAARHLDRVRAGDLAMRGKSSCRRLVPGSWIDVEEHTLGELNGRLVIASVRHEGRRRDATDGGPVYWNSFRAAPATVPLRPPRPRPRPVRPNETATVVGPAGKEIHTDALGRVKVKFHWDLDGRNDDTRSCWVRTMQSWAGPSWGYPAPTDPEFDPAPTDPFVLL